MRLKPIILLYLLLIVVSVLLIYTGGCNKTGGGHSHSPEAGEHSHESVGSGDQSDHGHAHRESPTISVTLWTPKMELFAEYPMPVKGVFVKFIIHLTKLKDFQPVQSGKVILSFKGSMQSESITVEHDRLLREGIFTPLVRFTTAGTYNAAIKYKGEGLEETFGIGTLKVVESEHELPEPEEEANNNAISFLKEQQWKIEFRTEVSREMTIKSSVSAVAEVLPTQKGFVEVITPVAGILDIGVNKYMAAPGSVVKRGDIVALLAPPAGGGDSWQQIKLALEQAKNRFERAQRLLNEGAIAKREYENLQRQYLLLKSGFPGTARGERQSRYFIVTAPIDGIVKDVAVVLGQYIQPGQKILSIVDSTKVWLKINLFERDYYSLGTPSGATLHIPALDTPIHLPGEQMKLLSKSDLLDPRTKTIPLLFEIENPTKTLKIGHVLQVQLYTDIEKPAICVPGQAVYDDEGQKAVFVQIEGESFEKRTVKTGAAYSGWVEIESGLKAGERVVTQGAYLVKLASTSTPIGHGHTH